MRFPSHESTMNFKLCIGWESDLICKSFSCTCRSKTETACVHIIGILQRLEHQRALALSNIYSIVHEDKCTKRFCEQYQNSIGDLVAFEDLEEHKLLPGAVIHRPGRPKSRLLVKRGTNNTCGHCGLEGHNKILCPRLNKVCSMWN